MVLDDDFMMNLEEHAAMLQNKALIQNNVKSKRKEQLKHWESSEMNRLCPRRDPSHQSKVKFQDRDIFLSACQSGDEEEVEQLLNKGSDINVSSIDGVTALHQAVIDGNMDVVRFLVLHGADINAQDNEGWTPLHAAVCCGNLPIVKFLYEHGAELTFVNSDRELPVDLAENDEMRAYLEEEMRKLGVDEQKVREREFNMMLEDCNRWIQTGEYIDSPHPRTGATALHVAASKGYNKLIELLIRAGANINAQDFEGWTPLHAAAHWGERDACRILMENGATLEAITHTGHTVLAVADKTIEEYLYGLKEKFNELRSGALLQQQHQQQQQKEEEMEEEEEMMEDESEWTEVTATPSSSCSVPVPQPPQPPPRNTTKISVNNDNISSTSLNKDQKQQQQIGIVQPNASSSSAKTSTIPPLETTKTSSEPNSSLLKVPSFATENGIGNNSSISECSVSVLSNSSVTDNKKRVGEEMMVERRNSSASDSSTKTTTTTTSKEAPYSSSTSSREGSHSSTTSSASSYSEKNRSNTGSGVSSIQTTSRSVTPKDRSSSLYSSDQDIQCTVHVGPPNHSSSQHSSITSSTTTNHSQKSTTNSNHKSAVLRAAEETIKFQRLRKQLPPNVQIAAAGVDRAKSQSVDYGKPAPPLDPPLKSPPASAPLVQSARLFWHSIGNNPANNSNHCTQPTQQNHPLGSTQLHQQQFHQHRQRFLNQQQQSSMDSAELAHQSTNPSPFAIVAGEEQHRNKREKGVFRRGESLKAMTGMTFSVAPQVQHGQPRRPQAAISPLERPQTTNNESVKARATAKKQEHFLFGNAETAAKLTATTAAPITSTASNNTAATQFESPSGDSSMTTSPSPSPIILNSPFVTIRKQSWQQSTPPTPQKESESERKAKSKLKRSTRRSTQGVTLEQLGEATGRIHHSHNNHHQNGHGRGGGGGEQNKENLKIAAEDRIQQVNAKFNRMMEKQINEMPPPQSSAAAADQLQPPGSPGCSSASSSSAYMTAPNNSNRQNLPAPTTTTTGISAGIVVADSTSMTVANFSSTALLIDELNKYKQLYEKERDECERLRCQVQELSAEARAKASNQLRGMGWRPGATLIQRTELPSGITYSTVSRPTDRISPENTNHNGGGISVDERRDYERRIAELKAELEKANQLRTENEKKLKEENKSIIRVLARVSNKNDPPTSPISALHQNYTHKISE